MRYKRIKGPNSTDGNLAADGRCCGRKPLEYKSGTWTPLGMPHKLCTRCYAEYTVDGKRMQQDAPKRAGGAAR